MRAAPPTRHENALGVLLAGGRGSRLGQDKALAEMDGSASGGRISLGRAVLSALSMCCPKLIVSVEDAGRSDLPRRLGFPETRIVVDERSDCGPLAGLEAALRAALGGAGGDPRDAEADGSPVARVFVAACDYPLLSPGAVSLLLTNLERCDAALPEIGGRLHPLCGAWSVRALPRLSRFLSSGGRKAVEFAGMIETARLSEAEFRKAGVDPSLSFFNVNTPDDLREAERRLAEGAGAVPPAGPDSSWRG